MSRATGQDRALPIDESDSSGAQAATGADRPNQLAEARRLLLDALAILDACAVTQAAANVDLALHQIAAELRD
ncbi:MAG: hypothetical protein JWM38_1518 [Sphingomonas bacterium]|jgi:hypothetical protein|nr:hypothetical protein [Sphingomonas bacterium]MDB5718091.1 hypothetical protein [Sphingomonas bacterium]